MSLPALTAAQPLAGIACAVGFLGDRLRVTPWALTWEVLGLLAMVAGVVVIGRHPSMPAACGGGPERDRGNAAPRPERGGGDAAPRP
jgi:hypothetical protein